MTRALHNVSDYSGMDVLFTTIPLTVNFSGGNFMIAYRLLVLIAVWALHIYITVQAFHQSVLAGFLTLFTFIAGDLYWAYQWWSMISLAVVVLAVLWAINMVTAENAEESIA